MHRPYEYDGTKMRQYGAAAGPWVQRMKRQEADPQEK